MERAPDLDPAQQPPAERVRSLELCGMRGHARVALWASVGCRGVVLLLLLLLLRCAPLSIAAPAEHVRALRDDWIGHKLRADLSKGRRHMEFQCRVGRIPPLCGAGLLQTRMEDNRSLCSAANSMHIRNHPLSPPYAL